MPYGFRLSLPNAVSGGSYGFSRGPTWALASSFHALPEGEQTPSSAGRGYLWVAPLCLILVRGQEPSQQRWDGGSPNQQMPVSSLLSFSSRRLSHSGLAFPNTKTLASARCIILGPYIS